MIYETNLNIFLFNIPDVFLLLYIHNLISFIESCIATLQVMLTISDFVGLVSGFLL